MILATFRASKDGEAVSVELPDDRLEEVLIRAGTRVCRQLDGDALNSHVARYEAVMRERAAAKHKEKRRAA